MQMSKKHDVKVEYFREDLIFHKTSSYSVEGLFTQVFQGEKLLWIYAFTNLPS